MPMFTIKPGCHVRVKIGLFEGAEGTVLNKCHEVRSVIALDLRQKSVTLEIDDCWLEPTLLDGSQSASTGAP